MTAKETSKIKLLYDKAIQTTYCYEPAKCEVLRLNGSAGYNKIMTKDNQLFFGIKKIFGRVGYEIFRYNLKIGLHFIVGSCN